MSIYYITIFLFLLLGFLYQRLDTTSIMARGVVTTSIASLIVVYGLRYQVGEDWFSYLNVYFRSIMNPFSFDTWEIGYKYINVLSYYLVDSIWLVILICTSVFILFTFIPLTRSGLNPYYFFAMVAPYHLVMSGVNFTRQAVALSLFLMAFSYIIEGKKGRFLIFTFLASSFHISAICFLPLYFADWKKRYLLFSLITPLPILYYLITSDYQQYIAGESENAGLLLRTIYLLIPSILVAFLYFPSRNKYLISLIELRLFYVSLLSFPVVMSFSLLSTTMADRFSYYFILINTYIWLLFSKKIIGNKNYKAISNIVIFLTSLVAFILWTLFSTYSESYEFDSYLLYWF